MAEKDKKTPPNKTVTQNRKARFEYEILETYEAGLVLMGSEVKSLRGGKASIEHCYVTVKDEQLWLVGANIQEYKQAHARGHEPTRARKLLMHKREIIRLIGKIKEKGLTLTPLEVYFNKRGIAKLRIALGKGKKEYDKRESIKKRDWERSKQRKEF